MGKYLLTVLILLLAGMGISISKQPPDLYLFYSMLGGAIIVIIYNGKQNRKKHDKEGNLK